MTGFGMMAWLFLSWAAIAPKSLGWHIAVIVDAYDRKRSDLRAQRRAAP